MDPRGIIGRIYKKDHHTLQHTKKKALGLVVLEKFFYGYPIACLWELMTPEVGAIFDPRGMVGRIYTEDHDALLHIKYESSRPCGLREEVFYVFTRRPRDVAPMDPRGA